MFYHIFIKDSSGKFNIFGVSEEKMPKVVEAYLLGSDSITLSGRKYLLNDVSEFRIFCHDAEKELIDKTIQFYMNNSSYYVSNFTYRYLPVKTLGLFANEVTENFIGDHAFGYQSKKSAPHIIQHSNLINESRINELKNIRHKDFDLSRLIKLCEEINSNYLNSNYLSVGMIGRTILHHIPPIFGFNSFEEFSNNYGGIQKNKSFKKLMQNLNSSLNTLLAP